MYEILFLALLCDLKFYGFLLLVLLLSTKEAIVSTSDGRWFMDGNVFLFSNLFNILVLKISVLILFLRICYRGDSVYNV